MRRVCLYLVSAALLLGSGPLAAQEQGCDPQLKQTREDPHGYRLRGDRCEGVYIREVGSTPLVVVSLTESVEDFDAATGKPLLVEWTAPEGAKVHIRARALRHRLYYQMDTVRPPGSKAYGWPVNLLSSFNLRKNELGLVAWAPYAVGSATRDVYMPLRVSLAKATRSPSYQLTVLPGVELSEVYFSVAPVGADGQVGSFLKKDEPLKYSYYPANRAVTIPLPALGAPGIYFVEIKAIRKAGGSTSAPPLWLYHAGQ